VNILCLLNPVEGCVALSKSIVYESAYVIGFDVHL
jgi:hypothetical protein